MQNAFDGLINRLKTKDMTIKTSKTKKKRKKNWGGGEQQNIQELWNYKRYNMYAMRTPDEEKEKRKQEMFKQ